MAAFWEKFQHQFVLCFINEDRWKFLLKGLGLTIRVTFIALIIGLLIGVIVSLVRSSYDKTYAGMRRGLGRTLLKCGNVICKTYLTVFRGTPSVVQLLIWYFVIFASSNNKVLVACIAFGFNSGAYIAEIMRAGIMSVDVGQTEAGRSLGLNFAQTMRFIILPQAFKNVLPALCNECIVLLKETAICGYIALQDLTKAGDIIRGRTFIAFLPLIAVALIYLLMVLGLTWLLGKLERRLRASDTR